MNNAGKVIGLLAIIAAAFYAARSFASTSDSVSSGDFFTFPGFDFGGDVAPQSDYVPADQYIPYTSDITPVMSPDQNIAAFLALIGKIESRDDYSALVGGGTFSDFTDHPANLGWSGIKRSDGRLTTAAGRYQITRTTWNDLGGIGKYGSFAPQAQDAAAIDLLIRRGALADVQAGNFDAAVAKLPQEWEAFARIMNGTYAYTMDQARQIYASNGGTFA